MIPVPGLKVTDAVVSMDSGGVPFWASPFENAMLKQEACAAAISSSGVVTEVDPSLRAFQLMSNVPMPEDWNATVPDPSVKLPFQTVVASLVTVI
ncbi:hypothetical protein GCM10017690_13700 [Microbacterium terregens]